MDKVTSRFVSSLFAGSALGVAMLGCADVPQDHDLVIRRATIVDVETGELRPDQFVAIDGPRITAIGAEREGRLHRGALEVNANGNYAIPGLWDMHVHIEDTALVQDNLNLFPVYLAFGVTSVRDMASDLGEQVLVWRDDVAEGRILGPQIFTAGLKIEGINSVWRGDLEVGSVAEMLIMMDRLDAYGVDFVKVTENALPADLFLETVREARRRGYLVSGHVPHGTTVETLARSGISSIEHGSYMLRLGSAEEPAIAAAVQRGELTRGEADAHYWTSFQQEQASRGYEMLAELDIAVTPTLIGGRQMAYLDQDPHDQDEYQAYLTQAFMAPYAARSARVLESTSEQREQRKQRFQLLASQLPMMQEAGVVLLAGSDSAPIAAFVYPGLALHEELEIFQNAGLSPIDVLRAATLNAARFLGQEGVAGSLAATKYADLVLLRENPLANIEATQSIEAVIAKGRFLSRDELDAMLDRARDGVRALDAAQASSGPGQ